MHREGSEGEREKSVICPKRWKEGDTRESGSEEPRGGLGRFGFIPTSGAEYSLLHLQSLNRVVISTLPFVLLYLFIAALLWTINLTCLPTERQSCVAGLRDACLSPSDLRNAQRLQTDTGKGLTLVSLTDCVCLRTCLHGNSSCCS